MQKIALILCCIVGFIAPNVFAANHVLPTEVSIDYELPYNEPQTFTNIFFWTIKASCVVISNNNENHIGVKMLRKTAIVNNLSLTAGDDILLTINSNDNFNISADSGAKVELTNLNEEKIIARCSPM